MRGDGQSRRQGRLPPAEFLKHLLPVLEKIGSR
jgi:hypothetical protein